VQQSRTEYNPNVCGESIASFICCSQLKALSYEIPNTQFDVELRQSIVLSRITDSYLKNLPGEESSAEARNL
jgi:hypothetical protein